MDRPNVLVVGAGFSGLMLAVHLMSDPMGPRVTLFERRREWARGRAYADLGQPWKLNVCAGNMSAFPADPGHFLRWWQDRAPGGGHHDFVERRIYGEYLQDVLAVLRSRPDASERLVLVQGEAVDARVTDGGASIATSDGRRFGGEHLVLAVGSGAPRQPPGCEGLDGDLFVADPWSDDVGGGLDPGDEVFLVGTGLTMVDACLALAGSKSGVGAVHALSRRGLLPRAHRIDLPSPPAPPSEPPQTVAAGLAELRRTADLAGWRGAVDALRPATTRFWRGLPEPERRRFLRHLRPWWDVHRHRLAPELGARLESLIAEGRLRPAAGRLVGVERAGRQRLRVVWRPRGERAELSLIVRRVVNCTGLGGFGGLAAEPMIGALRSAGRIREDADRLGAEVDVDSRAVGADGSPNSRLSLLGPLTQGAFWEATAVPDLRNRALLLAVRLRQELGVGTLATSA